MKNLINEGKIIKVADAAAAGTTDITGATIDIGDGKSIVLVTAITTKAANNFLQAQSGALANGSDAAALSGGDVAAVANGDVCAIEIFEPSDRYITPVIKRGTSTATSDIWAIVFDGRKKPINNGQITTLTGYVAKFLQTPAKA